MKRLNDDEIILTQKELDDIEWFIRNALEREWDRYTDNCICSETIEAGMRRMNPEMYDFASSISSI